MKRFEEQIKDTMLAQQDPVQPAHVATFRNYLLGKKRTRRKFLIWLLFGSVILAGSGIVWFQLRETNIELDTDQLQDHATLEMSSGVLVEVPNKSSNSENLTKEESKDAKTIAQSSSENQLLLRANVQSRATKQTIASYGSTLDKNQNTTIEKPTTNQLIAQNIIPIENISIVDQKQAQLENIKLPGDLEKNTTVMRATVSHGLLLDGIKMRLPEVSLPLLNPVQPVTARHMTLRYGAVGAWFVTRGGQSITTRMGRGFQLGGFVTYSFDRRWSVSAEAGFMHIDSGFDFDKQSVTSQFGFVQRSQANTLSIHQLYSWYGGLSCMYRMRRHSVEIGVQVYHVYGARGDITRTETEDNQPTTTTNLTKVWVSTDGLAGLPADMLVGYRYCMNETIQIALRVRLPLSSLESTSTTAEYAYMSNGYRFAPQIGVYYHFK